MENATWQVAQHQPTAVVKRYVGAKVHRAEGWKIQQAASETLLVGYLTLTKAEYDKVLSVSGKHSIFHEALVRDNGDGPVVQWLQQGELTGISYMKYGLQEAGGKPLAFQEGQGSVNRHSTAAGAEIPLPFRLENKRGPCHAG